ncbi:hypothetical protein NDA11_005209 [Ustilago hordei]|uniref:Uncharacterized protein n=1 Tax=Ustilago hordei TaxID=120017 RepID=I2G6E9_USTHO|nr:uncharacterized protein UHO2_02123 [Ustilago hordei]KAJ1038971.1 hypothetical protein NDA10_000670 [Ustilago hordei]KAJ1586035.1 hypothetical protein NDA12_004393 [Ustilago hordei]KAJ1589106.1 hypothetical protein NDA15_002412 [Ustilago hordei]KAJ1591022.1 hypothetical protein NDA11_005209 [Ustilago hordei]KAJ1601161.1 hypothetical protein NDA14_007676 [Ustilago hordei]
MSERDETVSVSASQKSSHTQSVKEDIVKEGLAPEHLESLYTDLPSDATALKAIVGTMRLELSKKDTAISKLKEEIDEVKASHSVVLQRSAEWQDELETLRLRVPQLEEELRNEKQAREAESDRVKDLRIRAEESRRAIMRLQGEQSDARAKAKVDNRRSWVPAATNPPAVRDEQEEAQLKKSKRASLAFGPNALNINTLANRPGSSHGFGHRRTASGGRSVSGASGASKGDGEADEEPLSPTFANGLRGLRLSGTAGMNGTMSSASSLLTPNAAVGGAGDDNGSAPNSRRNSFRSDAGKSPRLGLNDLPLQDGADLSSSLGARLSVPSAASGGTSGQRNSLLSSPALSQSGAAGSVGVGSPIIEDNEEEESHNSTSKALPNLPTRESSIHSLQSHDRELRAKEVEIERLTREMTEMRLSMEEALEARKASEACLKALRDFIAHHDEEADAEVQMGDDADRIVQRASFGAGLLKGVKLPPLPTDDMDENEEAAHVKASSLSQQKQAVGMGGWGVKLPTLMRKATSSTTSNGPTPSDERSGMSPSSEGEGGLGSDSAAPAPPAKSIASGFAGFSNLLARSTATTPNDQNLSSSTNTTPASESASATSPQLAAEDAAGSAFKPFGWFKRSSVLGHPNASSASPSAAAAAGPQETIQEKVLSPPFRSLDHDQLSISRQSVILPPPSPFAEYANDTTPTTSTSASSIRPPSGSGSNGALAMAARMADEENAKKVAESVKSKDLEMSHRAQRAAEKTGSVEHLTDVLPLFD